MRLLLILILLTPYTWAAPCGKEGTLDERIKDCNLSKENFVLIARDEKNFEIYKDLKTGLIWADRISSDFNHYGSQKACAGDNVGVLILKDMKWRLPSIKEFEGAASHGMKEALPNMKHSFWTSTPVSRPRKSRRRRSVPTQVFIWDGTEEITDMGDLKDAASVRCVTH